MDVRALSAQVHVNANSFWVGSFLQGAIVKRLWDFFSTGSLVRLWMLRRDPQGSSARRFHAYADRAVWNNESKLFRRIKLILRSVVWPVTAAILAAACVARYGRPVKAQSGPGTVRQWSQQWMLAVRHLILPLEYYKFGFHRADRRSRVEEYVCQREGLVVFPVMNGATRWDKPWFAESCERFGLAHVPVAIVLGAREAQPPLTAAALGQDDLFVKPSYSGGGRGVQRWWRRDGAFKNDEGQCLSADRLAEHLKKISRDEDYVVQRMIVNHADIARISNGALCTIRALVGLKKGSGKPELIFAALRMGLGPSPVDNFAAGGIAAPIDLATGRLGPAVSKDPGKPRFAKHPDTLQPIVGTVVPMWTECVALCLKAHSCFAPAAVIGWDIAVTADGPILVEGNPTSCVELIQMSHDAPLLSSGFGDVVLSYFE